MTNLESILSRHSYRGLYAPTPVPREDLRKIMEAGLAAPSGCNKQTTSLIAVDDPELIRRLHAVIQAPTGKTAPAMICVLTNRAIAFGTTSFAVQDYSAAIENMLIAINALGYASVWIEGDITDEDRIGYHMGEILGVPEGTDLVCFLPVGIPMDTPRARVKRPFEERAWFNGYGAQEEA